METATDQSLAVLDRLTIWHPFTQMQTSDDAIPIVRGEGCYLYDERGRRYIDSISSWWVNLHGHAHPYIVEKIALQAAQLEHVIFAGFTHEPAVTLTTRLLQLLPATMSKLFFSDNGSTAVETALKMALQFWYNQDPKTHRRKILCFKNSYHGDTFGAMSAAGKNHFNKPFWKYLFEVEAIDPPVSGDEKGSLLQLQTLLENRNCACFIFEPLLMAAGGMIHYSAEALDSLLSLCRQHGVLTIADEVMTGFGRLGPLFATELLQEKPDLICLSKGITGGFLPLGATLCTETIYQAFLSPNADKALLHGHSYTGNPIACSAALASLDLLVKQECSTQRIFIENSHQQFCEKWKGHPKLKRCLTVGTVLILEYQDRGKTFRDRLYRFFLSKGILLRPLDHVLYVMPPYCITEQDLCTIYHHIEITLSEDI